MFHKEGQTIIFVSLIIVGSLFLVMDFIGIPWLVKTLQIGLLIVFILILQFFRNPKRNTQIDDTHVVSPVDGKVVVIEEVQESEYFKEKRLQVSVFMSPINVHVTRYPIGGKVIF
ncbi:MAG: phosphatidylserine decarboxylase family protein, partial [Flavobacteriaceae bacterium]|nr:phosphatidylserine decarboxylase family protein [Flavobacteriaceae bacterium]